MPEFARRFFNDKKQTFKASSYYAYALELKEFFDYLGTTSYDIDKMKISDMGKITPEVLSFQIFPFHILFFPHVKIELFNRLYLASPHNPL